MRRKPTHSKERGQALILFVLGFAVLAGMVALVIDIGLFLQERRSVQNAADAAALAAAGELPASPSDATAAALQWANKNGYQQGEASISVAAPYNGDPESVEVVIETNVPFFFARVLGKDQAAVRARAVATRGEGYGYAIFAHASGCGSPNDIDISGSNFDVTGQVHSNGDLKVTTSDASIQGAVTSVCTASVPESDKVTATRGIKQVSATRDWPVFYEFSDFGPCTFSTASDLTISPQDPQYWLNDDPSTKTLKPGVYCSEGAITVKHEASGNITFVAKGDISLSGARFNLQAYQNDVMAYSAAASDNAIKLEASQIIWQGILLAPWGQVQISGSTVSSDSGSIFGDTVKISASSGTITAKKDDNAGSPRLVE